jgi:hypothetical protein
MELAACLALGNLAADNKENSWAVVAAGAIPLLLEGMDMAEIKKSQKNRGVRSHSATFRGHGHGRKSQTVRALVLFKNTKYLQSATQNLLQNKMRHPLTF